MGNPILTRVKNMVSRAVTKLVDDTTKMQLLQIRGLMIDDSEEIRSVERFQNYGFTSVPLEGAEAAVVYVEGRRDHGVAIVVDDRRYRLKGLQDGEVAIYTDQGDNITIKRGGTIVITASTKIQVSAPTVELAGNSDALALASKVDARCAAIEGLLTGAGADIAHGKWVPVPNDGGAALKVAAVIALGSAASTASSKVKAE